MVFGEVMPTIPNAAAGQQLPECLLGLKCGLKSQMKWKATQREQMCMKSQKRSEKILT